jgi:glycosyltransferase involved in cell wall biosynthesis
MRIGIVSSGRLWLCDLARELSACGHRVRFYSLVPPWRTRQFGLPAECNHWLGLSVAPFYAAARALSRTSLAEPAEHCLVSAVDHAAARVVEDCDVLIGASQMCLRTIEAVRARCGARIILERGSRHILSQREILNGLPRARSGEPRVPDWAVRRELAEYALADTIVVPSKHVERSFIEHGIPAGKLFRNPYGVDLRMFPPTPAPSPVAAPTVLMAGWWSLRKGCDLLVEAWRTMRTPGVRLLHVGDVHDCPLPSHPRFEHHERVDQPRLTHWYAQAHVMALASREEGLALVQAQGLASGLHLAATERTGAEDLQELLDDPRAVAIAPVDDAGAFAATLDTQLERARTRTGLRDLLGGARTKLTWQAYGLRYDTMLRHA